MTAPIASPGLWIPFANPVELFSVNTDGVIDFTGSYKAVCHRLTAEGLSVLQIEATAPARLVVGVHCEGRVFFLPGNRFDFRPVGPGLFALQARFTTAFDPKSGPPKIEFIPEEYVVDWVREVQERHVPEEEKRQHERAVYTESIGVSGAPAGHPAFALNLSEGGIALITTFPLTPGEVRVLTLPQPDGTTKRRKTRLVRCTPLLPRFYEVGGQFVTS